MANAIAAEAAAAAAQPTWDIRLNEVECTEVALSLMLRPLHGSFSMKWIKKFGGGTPDVLLVFDGQKPAETALTMLGAGRRGTGGFRVTRPAWAEPEPAAPAAPAAPAPFAAALATPAPPPAAPAAPPSAPAAPAAPPGLPPGLPGGGGGARAPARPGGGAFADRPAAAPGASWRAGADDGGAAAAPAEPVIVRSKEPAVVVRSKEPLPRGQRDVDADKPRELKPSAFGGKWAAARMDPIVEKLRKAGYDSEFCIEAARKFPAAGDGEEAALAPSRMEEAVGWLKARPNGGMPPPRPAPKPKGKEAEAAAAEKGGRRGKEAPAPSDAAKAASAATAAPAPTPAPAPAPAPAAKAAAKAPEPPKQPAQSNPWAALLGSDDDDDDESESESEGEGESEEEGESEGEEESEGESEGEEEEEEAAEEAAAAVAAVTLEAAEAPPDAAP